jgi:hypothetical protein
MVLPRPVREYGNLGNASRHDVSNDPIRSRPLTKWANDHSAESSPGAYHRGLSGYGYCAVCVIEKVHHRHIT